MTIKDRGSVLKKEISSLLLLFGTLMFGLVLSGDVSEYIKEGLALSVGCVIPSSFPFMIISDMYVSYGKPENIRLLRRTFTFLFGLPPSALAPFICGNLGGFPIGAKMASECYSAGTLTKDEAERLIPLSNNPSCAFIVGGVGLGIFGDLKIGLMLLFSIYSATVICGILTRGKIDKKCKSGVNIGQNYDFISSVKNSGLNSISIISFISLFSAINGILKKCIKNTPILYLISAFCEVTNAVKIFASDSHIPPHLSLVFSAFALGFGGICVGLQSAVFTSASGLKMKKYYLIKLLNAIIAACVFSILLVITK